MHALGANIGPRRNKPNSEAQHGLVRLLCRKKSRRVTDQWRKKKWLLPSKGAILLCGLKGPGDVRLSWGILFANIDTFVCKSIVVHWFSTDKFSVSGMLEKLE